MVANRLERTRQACHASWQDASNIKIIQVARQVPEKTEQGRSEIGP